MALSKKKHADGPIEQYKERLVAKGSKQMYGMNYPRGLKTSRPPGRAIDTCPKPLPNGKVSPIRLLLPQIASAHGSCAGIPPHSSLSLVPPVHIDAAGKTRPKKPAGKTRPKKPPMARCRIPSLTAAPRRPPTKLSPAQVAPPPQRSTSLRLAKSIAAAEMQRLLEAVAVAVGSRRCCRWKH